MVCAELEGRVLALCEAFLAINPLEKDALGANDAVYEEAGQGVCYRLVEVELDC